MDAKILQHTPMSGRYKELQFDVNDQTTWVIFEDEDYDEYCGSSPLC